MWNSRSIKPVYNLLYSNYKTNKSLKYQTMLKYENHIS